MPWSCKACQTKAEQEGRHDEVANPPEISDDVLQCPRCNVGKGSWTLAPDVTRTFTVGRKKLELKRCEDYQTRPRGDPPQRPALKTAKYTWALPKQLVSEIAARDHAPAPGHLLYAHVAPRRAPDRNVRLAVDYVRHEIETLEFPRQEADVQEGLLEVKFLFVYGPDSLPDGISFPGVEIVDVTEADTPEGYAPTVKVSAGKGRPAVAPVKTLPWLDVRVDLPDGPPCSTLYYEVSFAEEPEPRTGVLPEDGVIFLYDVPEGEFDFALRPVWIDVRLDPPPAPHMRWQIEVEGEDRLRTGRIPKDGIIHLEGVPDGEVTFSLRPA